MQNRVLLPIGSVSIVILSAAMVLVAAMIQQAHGETPIACSPSHPGDKRPVDWAYRTIDGRQCWYRGRQMLPKHKLYWAPPEPPWLRPTEDPEVTLPQEPWAMEHRWPVLGRGE